MNDEISTADAVNALESLTRIFRGLQRGEDLIKAVATADGRLAEQDQQIRAGDDRLAELGAAIAERAEEAKRAEEESALRIAAARQRALDAEAKASADIVATQERANRTMVAAECEAGEELLRLDSALADRRAELAGLDRKIEDANAALASLRAKLG